jgi:hypothetical protein
LASGDLLERSPDRHPFLERVRTHSKWHINVDDPASRSSGYGVGVYLPLAKLYPFATGPLLGNLDPLVANPHSNTDVPLLSASGIQILTSNRELALGVGRCVGPIGIIPESRGLCPSGADLEFDAFQGLAGLIGKAA